MSTTDAAEAQARARQLLVDTAQQTLRDAKFHKRAQEHHRRQAVALRARYETFCQDLRAMGIEVIVETPEPPRPRSPSDRSYEDQG